MNEHSGIEGLVAVVSGGAQGIGAAIASALAARGAIVATLDIALGGRDGALSLLCDVSSEEQIDSAISEIEGSLGAPNIVVNNAGILMTLGTEDTGLAEWNSIVGVNMTGAFLLARRCIPAMKRAGFGRLINIGSNSGKMGGYAGAVAYAASKAGLHNLSRVWATELGPFGITANTVAACLIDTTMARGANLERFVERIPVGRLGRPEEVAWAVEFLADRRSGYINGEVMDVNGGFYLD